MEIILFWLYEFLFTTWTDLRRRSNSTDDTGVTASILLSSIYIEHTRSRQNGLNFADDNFKSIFFMKIMCQQIHFFLDVLKDKHATEGCKKHKK